MLVREKIRQFIISEFISDDAAVVLTDTAPLVDSGIIDSFGIIALLGYLEESFSIQLSGEDLVPENFSTIATISEFIAQKNGCQVGGECGL